MRLVRIWDGPRDHLGEGPVWDARLGEMLWVDILGHAVHRLDPISGARATVPVGQAIGWILPRDRHADFVVGLAGGFAILDIETGRQTMIADPEPDRPDNRLNDAKVDRWGRIWAGSKSDRDGVAAGALYRLDPDWSFTRMDDDYGVANGPTFSLNGTRMYHTDSAARTVHVFDLAADGSLAGKRVWLRFDDAWGYPDGMTTDAEGCIWIAHWDGGRVSRFTPDGVLLESLALPASNITSCAFGGPQLDRLFVTSSSIGCEGEADAGALFEIDPGVRGLPQCRFGG